MTSPDSTLDGLRASEQHLLRTVDSLAPEDWAEPSVLPDWTRAHVLAHLALNAEGLAGAVDGCARELVVPMYESAERRAADIEDLAQADPAEIRERVFAAGQALREALGLLDQDQWSRGFPRVRDGGMIALTSVPSMRRREVEIHHADLLAGYRPSAWPADFRTELLDVVTVDHADSPDSPAFAVHASDLDRTWTVGADDPVVEGSGADLGWWLVGRGSGQGLTCTTGDLPRLGPWRRTSAPTRET